MTDLKASGPPNVPAGPRGNPYSTGGPPPMNTGTVVLRPNPKTNKKQPKTKTRKGQ